MDPTGAPKGPQRTAKGNQKGPKARPKGSPRAPPGRLQAPPRREHRRQLNLRAPPRSFGWRAHIFEVFRFHGDFFVSVVNRVGWTCWGLPPESCGEGPTGAADIGANKNNVLLVSSSNVSFTTITCQYLACEQDYS